MIHAYSSKRPRSWAIVGSAVPTTVESIAATNSESISPAITRTSCGVHGTRSGESLTPSPYPAPARRERGPRLGFDGRCAIDRLLVDRGQGFADAGHEAGARHHYHDSHDHPRDQQIGEVVVWRQRDRVDVRPERIGEQQDRDARDERLRPAPAAEAAEQLDRADLDGKVDEQQGQHANGAR